MANVFGIFDKCDAGRGFAHRADHFVVSLVSDQNDVISVACILDGFQMDLRHQRACRVDGLKLSDFRLFANFWRNAMRRKEQD